MLGVVVVLSTVLVPVILASLRGCPADCFCDYTIHHVHCSNVGNVSWSQFWTDMPMDVERADIRGGEVGVIKPPPKTVDTFEYLTELSIEECEVLSLVPGAFEHLPALKELRLSYNNISRVNSSHFITLDKLEVLDISHNQLISLHEKTLRNLTALQILDLSYNELSSLPLGVLRFLNQLSQVDLSHNRIQYIHPNTFMDLLNLQILNLQDNLLNTLHDATFQNLSLSTVYLSENPWECHCGIAWLVEELKDNPAYIDVEKILCQLPYALNGKKVSSLDLALLSCDVPSVMSYPDNQTVQYMHSTHLHCNVSNQSPYSIYWITPRGIVVHPDHRRFLPPTVTEFSHRLSFDAGPSFWEASVEALANGTLLIKNFRMYFVGEYTCVAENPSGFVMVSARLDIYSILNSVMAFSTMLGYSIAIGFLVAGIIIGALRMCAEKHCKCCKPVPNKSISTEVNDAVNTMNETAASIDDYFREKHWSNEGTYYYEYDHTFRSPSLSPRMSPMKCVTPAEYEDEDGLAPPHLTDDIKELLIMVRASLRHGLESGTENLRTYTSAIRENSAQHLEHMRERASTLRNTFRESGTHTLQRMRTSSAAQYANRARTGVAMGLEQVKSHVQSMKELCGTGGDLGGQTVSVVSMETDVDSQESKQVVKSMTLI